MSDLSRAKSTHRADADGTRAEDDRQLTELLLQNRVSLKPETTAKPVDGSRATAVVSRIRTGFLLFVALPFSLWAYFFTSTGEDDFYG